MVDTFKKDKPKGEEAEYMVLEMIQKKYPCAYKKEGDFKYYDISVPEVGIKVEVKRDTASNNSSNYFIEYKCNSLNSGISSSTSNYYVIFDEYKFIWVLTDKLKTISKKYGHKWEGRTKGGCSPVKGYLVPKQYILEHSELIN